MEGVGSRCKHCVCGWEGGREGWDRAQQGSLFAVVASSYFVYVINLRIYKSSSIFDLH